LSPPTARRGALFLAVLLAAGGCASVADVTGTATQQDLMQRRAEMATLQRSVQRAQTAAETAASQTSPKTREQQAQAEQQTAALARGIDGLTATLATLTARMDELSTRVETMSRQARAVPPAVTQAPSRTMPTPSASPSTAVATPSATPTPPVSPATPSPTPAAPSATPTLVPATPGATPGGAPATGTTRPPSGTFGPQDIYQAAYIDFSKGSYPLAIAGFREFLRRYPEHELADNAQYWIGESQLSLARSYGNAGQNDRSVQALEQAVQEFKKVIANYPRGDKAPAALYKEALTLIELKQPAVAQSRLQYLVDNFPQAEETPLARERLASLRDR
jgi:tol-pal system protein YbgF